MQYRTILVPYDRSDSAKRALRTALSFAEESAEARVVVFFAAPMPEFESTQFLIAEKVAGVKQSTPAELAAMQEEYLAYEKGLILEDLGDMGVVPDDVISVAMGQGKPSKAILDYASDQGVDLIVMGCRGLNAVAGMLGSVSYAVLRGAQCPVLIEK